MLTRVATKGGGRQRECRPGSARLHFQCPTIHLLTVEPLGRRLDLRGRAHPTKANRPRAPGVTVHPDDPTGLSESLAHPLAGRREADPEKARRVRLLTGYFTRRPTGESERFQYGMAACPDSPGRATRAALLSTLVTNVAAKTTQPRKLGLWRCGQGVCAASSRRRRRSMRAANPASSVGSDCGAQRRHATHRRLAGDRPRSGLLTEARLSVSASSRLNSPS
jgi:hypothetical protein